MSSGSGLFHRKSSATPITPTYSSSPSSSTASTAIPSTSANVDSSSSRRRRGSAPPANVLGLMRRESVPTTASNATASRRSLTLDLNSPRKILRPGIILPSSPLSPKRKPLPKGSAFDKQTSLSLDDGGDLNGQLGKMELTGGSTMVFHVEQLYSNVRLLESACVVIQIYGFLRLSLVINVPSVFVLTISTQISL